MQELAAKDLSFTTISSQHRELRAPMAETSSSPSVDMAVSAAPFSYAQAARGKNATAAALSTDKTDSSSWADDVPETAISTIDHENAAGPTMDGTNSTDDAPSSPGPCVPEATEDISNSTTTDAQQNNDLPKEDDIHSETKQSSEATWESKSQTSNTAATSQSPSEERGRALEKDKPKSEASSQVPSQAGEEKIPEVTLKDAPLPAVNIWQQRASEAKAKQVKQPSPAGHGTTGDVSATSRSDASKSQVRSPAVDGTRPPRRAPGRPADDSRSAGPTNTIAAALSRSHRSEGDITRSTQLPPPVGDTVSWPTPLTAQDDEKRRAQQTGAKGEKERSGSTTSKPHGRNDWTVMNYTPSVKFETPLPIRGGRGGRLGARGGRGGAIGERSSTFSHALTGADPARVTRQPQKIEGSDAQTSSLSESQARIEDVEECAKPTPEPSKIPEKQDHIVNGAETSAQLTDEANPAQASPEASTLHSAESGSGRQQPSEGAATDDSGRESRFKPEQSTSQAYLGRKKPTPSFQDMSVEPVVGQKQKRRGSQAINRNDASNPDFKERRRTTTDFESLAERLEHPAQGSSFDASRDSWVPQSHRERPEGRADRGRGFKGRGTHATSTHYNAAAGQLPQHQTATHGKGNHAFQPHQYSQSGTYSNNSRTFKNNPRAASIPNDTSFGRYAGGYAGSYGYAYPGYGDSMYPYGGMMSMGANSFNPYVEQTLLMTEITNQLRYYFSLENMLKDLFLRKHMDSQGFVSLKLIANFKRMRELTQDMELIKHICLQLEGFDFVTGADGQNKLRINEGWEKWVLSMEERDPSARNDGTPNVPASSTAYSSLMEHQSMSNSTFIPHVAHAQPQSFSATATSFSPLPMNSSVNGYRGTSPTTNGILQDTSRHQDSLNQASRLHEESLSPVEAEGDAHHDDQTKDLRIAMRPLNSDLPKASDPSESKQGIASSIPNGTGAQQSGSSAEHPVDPAPHESPSGYAHGSSLDGQDVSI